MLLESFLPSSTPELASAAEAKPSSASSLGEYSAYSVPDLSSAGACSLAPLGSLLVSRLVCRRSVLVRLCSMLVRRLSVGGDEGM